MNSSPNVIHISSIDINNKSTKKFSKGKLFLEVKQEALLQVAFTIDDLNGENKLNLRALFTEVRPGSDQWRSLVRECYELVRKTTHILDKAL